MGAFFDTIPPNILAWIEEQEMFWVATAPLTQDGHINVSPKGLRGTFHIINPNKVWYEDISGSGVETIAHVKENGRITVMFSAFKGPPRIVRLFGKGTVHEFGSPEYEALIPAERRHPGSRSAIVVDVYKVGSSCGYAVPFYEFKQHRTALLEFYSRREGMECEVDTTSSTPTASAPTESAGNISTYTTSVDPPSSKGLRAYWVEKNLNSLDGLPGVQSAQSTSRLPQSNWTRPKKGAKDKDDIGTEELLSRAKGAKRKERVEEFGRMVGAFLVGMLVMVLFRRYEEWVAGVVARVGVSI